MAFWPEHWTSCAIIRHGLAEILENQRRIMADISKLQESVATLQADVTSLINKPTVPTQADIDALQATVDQTDAAVKAALAQP